MLLTDWELQVLSLSLHVYAIPTYMQSSYREQEVLELVTHFKITLSKYELQDLTYYVYTKQSQRFIS